MYFPCGVKILLDFYMKFSVYFFFIFLQFVLFYILY